MKKVFIIHGFYGSPNGGWRPWLMSELAKKDIYACALPMPDPDKPKKEEWVKTIAGAVGVPNEEIFLVGHSLGVPAILRYLETLDKNQKIGGAVLVSGPVSILNGENKESKLRKVDNFLDTPFNFDYIKQKSKSFVVIHGDNDEKVPFEHALIISKNLSGILISVPNGGHLNGSVGWHELPQLLESLEKMF